MYSSLDNPTYEEWLIEYDRLLRQLRHHERMYSKKTNKVHENRGHLYDEVLLLKAT